MTGILYTNIPLLTVGWHQKLQKKCQISFGTEFLIQECFQKEVHWNPRR